MSKPGSLRMDTNQAALATAFARYKWATKDESESVHEFMRFLSSDPAVFQRSHPVGHFTGSAWLVSADGRRVLLTHHRKLGRWLQLGGHADGDEDLARVALREAEEESGLCDLVIADPEIFDIDRHWIPARNDEPGHWHYDVRFMVRATGSEEFAVSEESLELAWLGIEAIAGDNDADISLRRMAQKWLRRAVQ